MKAIVVDAVWDPRPGVVVDDKDAARKWAVNANDVYRSPSLSLENREDPSAPGPRQVTLEVGACGVCGSDVHMFETDDEGYMLLPYHLRAPVITGHEFSGTVVAAGETSGFEVGDIAAVEEIQWCGECNPCRGGYWNQCRNIEDLGFTLDGGFAEYVTVDAKFCWSLNTLRERYASDDEALEVGAMTEPTSVAYEAIFTRAGGFPPGKAVAVFGAGPIGLASVALARAAGASQIFCFEPLSGRRQLAGAIGATHLADPSKSDPVEIVMTETHGEGVSLVAECTGNFPAVIGVVEDVLGVGGKLAVIGMDSRSATLNFIKHQLRALSTYGSVGHSGSWDFPNVIALMASGRIEMEKAITRRYPLADLVNAIDETKHRADGKILVKPHIGPRGAGT